MRHTFMLVGMAAMLGCAGGRLDIGSSDHTVSSDSGTIEVVPPASPPPLVLPGPDACEDTTGVAAPRKMAGADGRRSSIRWTSGVSTSQG